MVWHSQRCLTNGQKRHFAFVFYRFLRVQQHIRSSHFLIPLFAIIISCPTFLLTKNVYYVHRTLCDDDLTKSTSRSTFIMHKNHLRCLLKCSCPSSSWRADSRRYCKRQLCFCYFIPGNIKYLSRI